MDDAWSRAVATAAAGQPDPRSLTLDGAAKCPNGRLPSAAALDRFRNLEHLSIANVRLASLDGFPRLPALRRLILSDNRIAGGLDALAAAGLDALRDLDLSNNRIASVEALAPLAGLRLASLDLYECPVTKTEDYRVRVFGMIGTLKYLDKVDAEGNERPESDEEEEEDDDEEEDEEEEEDGEEVEGSKVAVNGSGRGRQSLNGVEGVEDAEEEGEENDEEDDEEEEDDDEDDEEGEEEEEEIGEGYSVQPITQAKDGLGGSTTAACSNEDKIEEVERDGNDCTNGSQMQPSASQANKRKNDGDDKLDGGSITDCRPSKHR